MNFDKVARVVERAAVRGIGRGAEIVLAESDAHVPVDPDRALLVSGKVSQDGPGAVISYNEPYAVVQHERMDFHHDAGRHAKFLEKAGTAKRQEVADAVAAEIRRALGT